MSGFEVDRARGADGDGQGFLFGRPMTGSSLDEHLARSDGGAHVESTQT